MDGLAHSGSSLGFGPKPTDKRFFALVGPLFICFPRGYGRECWLAGNKALKFGILDSRHRCYLKDTGTPLLLQLTHHKSVFLYHSALSSLTSPPNVAPASDRHCPAGPS